MSQKHTNPNAYHNLTLWRWSNLRRCWVRVTDRVQPRDAWGTDAYGWSLSRRCWDRIENVMAEDTRCTR